MIDIHSHILPFVDDGSGSIENSIVMLEDAISFGVTDMFLTPHYRSRCKLSAEEIKVEFEKFSAVVKEKGLPINLHLGQELFYTQELKAKLKDKTVATLANSKYILVEFSTETETDIPEAVYELSLLGFIPIVAHLERYYYADDRTAFEIKQAGGLVQINAESVLVKGRIYRKVKKMFKYALVDFVASDMHWGRKNRLADSLALVKKKFGEDAVKAVYYENAKKILKG
ncbi:MAG: hypothetical protein IJV99_01780 [Clostridia bacterium]|nr:hypothetical protein [Clostridia bacterium]